MKIAGKEISTTTFGIFAAVVLVIAYYIGSRTGKSKAKAGAGDQLAKDITGSELTYDKSQYSIYADGIWTAINGVFVDDSAINTLMGKMRTKSDVLQLITTFGNRSLLPFGIGGGTLPEWIYQRLNAKEIGEVNDIMYRNNITYTF